MVNYSNVLTETSEILEYFDKSLLEKIPKKLIEKIKANVNPQYNFTYNRTKKLNEQEIMQETKDLISAIYLMYCCDKKERQQLMNICRENENMNTKVEVKELFTDKKQEKILMENTELTNNLPKKIETQTWYQILYSKVRNFINKIFKKT